MLVRCAGIGRHILAQVAAVDFAAVVPQLNTMLIDR